MISLNMRLSHTPEVVDQLIAGEAVIMVPRQGQVKVLNEVGARIWALLDGTRTLGDVRDLLSAEYAVELAACEADLLVFVRNLLQNGLLEIKDADEKGAAPE